MNLDPCSLARCTLCLQKVNCLFVVVVVTADAIDAISCTSNSKLNPKGTRDASAGSTCWLSGHFASYVQFMKVWGTFCDFRVIQTKLFTLLSAFIFLWEWAQVFRRWLPILLKMLIKLILVHRFLWFIGKSVGLYLSFLLCMFNRFH